MLDILKRTKKTKLEDKLKKKINNNEVRNSSYITSEEQESEVKRTFLNFLEIDITQEYYNIRSKRLEHKIAKEKLPF